MEEKGLHLDLSSDAPGRCSAGEGGEKPFVGVHFTCCEVYARVYPNRDRTAYVGYCPRCAKRISLKIGPGGTDARFFTAR
jgi:hypothetical protein